jgi:hypothetical protein
MHFLTQRRKLMARNDARIPKDQMHKKIALLESSATTPSKANVFLER